MLVIQSHWGLQHLPFINEGFRPVFFPAESHDEALARLQYVVDHGRQACIVEGDPGSGKTFVSRLHAQLTRERGVASVCLNLRGATEPQLREEFANALGLPDLHASWLAIGQSLQHQVLDRRQMLVVCDDADLANPDALEQLRGLLERAGSGVTLVLTSRSASGGKLQHRFGDISELRVVLEPWTLEESTEYLIAAVVASGGHEHMFEPEALERIHARGQGRPRAMSHLARLSLLAGAGYLLPAVDAETVDSVADDLIA